MLNKFSKIFIAMAVCIFISNDANAQDAAFSHFYANPLYLNPAFAGATPKGCPRASLNWRDQWPGIGSSYITTSASWDIPLYKLLIMLICSNRRLNLLFIIGQVIESSCLYK